jgi:hypothetical protein
MDDEERSYRGPSSPMIPGGLVVAIRHVDARRSAFGATTKLIQCWPRLASRRCCSWHPYANSPQSKMTPVNSLGVFVSPS